MKDWLGIYHKNDNPNTDPLLSYTYFNGVANGTTEIASDKLPTEVGSYFIVMFTDDSYNEVSNRVEFQVVEETFSTNNNSSENGIKVYPNPVNSGERTYIKANYPIEKIDVYDMTGSIFYTSKNINNNATSIINQSLPKGVKALEAVKKFVNKSDKINGTNYRTRDAHATTYSTLRGCVTFYDNFEERKIFPGGEVNCIIRISNAHLKIVSQKTTIPAYGFSVKIYDNSNFNLNLPLVNFPLFPIDKVSHFLRLFTAINNFFSGKILEKFWQLGKILINLVLALSGLLKPSFVYEVLKLLSKWKNFILSF